jgi:hypothetical protein
MISFKVDVYDNRVAPEPEPKPRVLVLATTVPAVRDDGTPQFVLDLSLGLQRAFDVLIVAPRQTRWRTWNAAERTRYRRSLRAGGRKVP